MTYLLGILALKIFNMRNVKAMFLRFAHCSLTIVLELFIENHIQCHPLGKLAVNIVFFDEVLHPGKTDELACSLAEISKVKPLPV